MSLQIQLLDNLLKQLNHQSLSKQSKPLYKPLSKPILRRSKMRNSVMSDLWEVMRKPSLFSPLPRHSQPTINKHINPTITKRRSSRIRKSPNRDGFLVGEELEYEFQNNPVFTETPPGKFIVSSTPLSRITGLNLFTIKQLVERVKSFTSWDNQWNGYLTRFDFDLFFDSLIETSRYYHSYFHNQDRDTFIQSLFKTLTSNYSTKLDYRFLITSLTQFCSHYNYYNNFNNYNNYNNDLIYQRYQKVYQNIYLYDDTMWSENRLTPSLSLSNFRLYLSQIFKIQYLLQPHTKSTIGVSSDTLAEITSTETFKEFNIPQTDKLSLDNILKWYNIKNPND
jgi:hypothetical protein